MTYSNHYRSPNHVPKSIYDGVASGLDIRNKPGDDEIVEEYTVVIVTHNLQQAARTSNKTAVPLAGGEFVEFGDAQNLFEDPDSRPAEGCITGEFGRPRTSVRETIHLYIDNSSHGITF